MKFWILNFLFGPLNVVRADFGISAAIIGALASVGSTVAGLVRKPPKAATPQVVQPPTDAQAAQAQAEATSRVQAARGYRSTILSDYAQNYGLKTKLGA